MNDVNSFSVSCTLKVLPSLSSLSALGLGMRDVSLWMLSRTSLIRLASPTLEPSEAPFVLSKRRPCSLQPPCCAATGFGSWPPVDTLSAAVLLLLSARLLNASTSQTETSGQDVSRPNRRVHLRRFAVLIKQPTGMLF